ncbi:MAG: hypothetical protein GVY26_04295 [Bacteroidetes bacterium]|jgi:predicted metal-dependent peptidase|nr:hypothetical protein [Bacteroidota bacterium]
MEEQTDRLLTETSIQLLLEAPFYAHLLSGLVKHVGVTVPTVAVGLYQQEQLVLHVNPAFWNQLPSSEQRQGVLQHELLHIVFGHLFLGDTYPHRQIFNIAADLVVNQYIDKAHLPEGALRLDRFSDLQLEAKREVGYYYQVLLGLHRRGGKRADAQLLKEWLNGGAEQALDQHQLWSGVQRLSRAEQGNLRQNVEQVVQAVCQRVGEHGIGLLPSGLKTHLQGLTDKPRTLDWRRVLRLFAASSTVTTVRNTVRRPSRRYGTLPGSKVEPQQKILVAIDTSGSVADADLNRFFEEIHQLWRQRVEIKVLECDVSIKRVYDYRGQPQQQVEGRGGTSFDPPIQYANSNYRPDALVYFTDGRGRPPRYGSRCPVLWLITPGGIAAKDNTWHELPGQVVKMPVLDGI